MFLGRWDNGKRTRAGTRSYRPCQPEWGSAAAATAAAAAITATVVTIVEEQHENDDEQNPGTLVAATKQISQTHYQSPPFIAYTPYYVRAGKVVTAGGRGIKKAGRAYALKIGPIL